MSSSPEPTEAERLAVLLEERDRTIQTLRDRLVEYEVANATYKHQERSLDVLRSQLTEARAAITAAIHALSEQGQLYLLGDTLDPLRLVVAPRDKDR